MADEPNDQWVHCERCGIDTFHLVKVYSDDKHIERTLRCDNGHLRVDWVELPAVRILTEAP